MKLISKIVIIGSVIICLLSCANQKNVEEEFSFILAADWRYTAMEKYDSPMYFRGALEVIEKVGKGAFMISPGDVEPVDISHKMISTILGDDYPWYPVMGNHELEIPSSIDYLREINNDGTLLPNVVNKGPVGSEETTYSFDYGNAHFVVLNQYYDGSSDVGTDGDIVDALYEWLKTDLENTEKTHIFVAGHEPIVSIPDMQNGRHRHIGDSLDQYPRNAFRFHQLLLKHNVTAYLHGHTHSTSYSNINGLWQIDCGHTRGTESEYPEKILSEINERWAKVDNEESQLDIIINDRYNEDSYEIKKVMFYMNLTDGISYKILPDEKGLELFIDFYKKAKLLGNNTSDYFQTYYDNWSVNRSTFMKFKVFEDYITVDIYRNTNDDPAQYSIVKTIQL
ncbi:MAG: hypothetical protein DRQ01_06360 [Ignavibacteriae bacterium]|nr:MAG: hypothetical protein DRQ01_06360 [Ignavibacteriota bacterium]